MVTLPVFVSSTFYAHSLLNIGVVSNERNGDVRRYIKEFILIDLDTLQYKVEVLNEYIGKYTGIYTHATIA